MGWKGESEKLYPIQHRSGQSRKYRLFLRVVHPTDAVAWTSISKNENKETIRKCHESYESNPKYHQEQLDRFGVCHRYFLIREMGFGWRGSAYRRCGRGVANNTRITYIQGCGVNESSFFHSVSKRSSKHSLSLNREASRVV